MFLTKDFLEFETEAVLLFLRTTQVKVDIASVVICIISFATKLLNYRL